MKNSRCILLTLILVFCLKGYSQNKTITNLTEAYRFESGNVTLFTAYADQAVKEGLPRVAVFFRAIVKASSVHAGNFQKILTQMGIAVTSGNPPVKQRPAEVNVEDALKSVRTEAGILYAGYLDQANADGEKSAAKALRWAKETEQQSLQLYVDVANAIANDNTNSLPSFYWVCPKCGNLYGTANPEKECSFCYTEREKFVKIE